MKILLIILSLSFIFISCERRVVNQTPTSNPQFNYPTTQPPTNPPVNPPTTQPPSTGGGSSTISEGCESPGVGDQANNYYTVSRIISHGDPSPRSVHWSSKTDPRLSSTGDQNTFMTDSRLNVRVLLKPYPSQGGDDTYGRECQYEGSYQKLRLSVGVKTKYGGIYLDTHTFDSIDVNGCSDVYEFAIPSSSQPYNIEVFDVQWDFSCTFAHMNPGFYNEEDLCPFHSVWPSDCFEISLQYSTDYTRDIPH